MRSNFLSKQFRSMVTKHIRVTYYIIVAIIIYNIVCNKIVTLMLQLILQKNSNVRLISYPDKKFQHL